MRIKPPPKRLEFEKLLRDLGYRDRSPIYFEERVTKQINYVLPSGKAMGFYNTIVPYYNKKSYLYTEFYQSYHEPDIKRRISTLAENILFNEKRRIGEVYWKVVYTNDPTEFTLEERRAIFGYFIKDVKNWFTNGFVKFEPREGDMLVSNPYGPKINKGFTSESMDEGTKQRALWNKRLGFGDLKLDGFCYARYDQDLKLRPL